MSPAPKWFQGGTHSQKHDDVAGSLLDLFVAPEAELSLSNLKRAAGLSPLTLQRWDGVQMGTCCWSRHLLGLQALSRWEGKLVGV